MDLFDSVHCCCTCDIFRRGSCTTQLHDGHCNLPDLSRNNNHGHQTIYILHPEQENNDWFQHKHTDRLLRLRHPPVESLLEESSTMDIRPPIHGNTIVYHYCRYMKLMAWRLHIYHIQLHNSSILRDICCIHYDRVVYTCSPMYTGMDQQMADSVMV